jgi:Nif-specific regulatory protein
MRRVYDSPGSFGGSCSERLLTCSKRFAKQSSDDLVPATRHFLTGGTRCASVTEDLKIGPCAGIVKLAFHHMDTNLIVLAGPLKGTVFKLAEDETSIGRDPANQICIMDKSLSRHHCVIRREAKQFSILDLESHNGTLVNELPAKTQVLEHGDHIQIGSSHLLFLEHEDRPSSLAEGVTFGPSGLVTASAIKLKPESTFYGFAPELGALMKVSAAIGAAKSLPDLQRRLLEAIFDIVPAARGAIVFINENLQETGPALALGAQRVPLEALEVSRTVAQVVMIENVSIMSNDVIADETLGKSASLMTANIQRLLCVPLSILHRSIGLIYLDTDARETSFTKWHLEIVTAIANFTAGALDKARYTQWLGTENERLKELIRADRRLIGESKGILEVHRFISKVAQTDSTVLILGESGTGKELVAQAIHSHSARADKPFVAVNCAALSEGLLESELFGHEKGAFTGAIAQKRGKLEAAEGGTIFLDEFGEMSPTIQAKLLRVLEEREFERVGSTRTIKANVRILAATNKKFETAIADGSFRHDLYYRINVVSITLPPLRDRPEDIALLANYFVAKYSRTCKRSVTGFSVDARRCLMNYSWPGNVRELENCIERAIVLGSTDLVQVEDLPESILEVALGDAQSAPKYYDLVQEAKRQIVIRAVKQAGGNYTRAAELLDLHPNNLHRLIRNLNLKQILSN